MACSRVLGFPWLFADDCFDAFFVVSVAVAVDDFVAFVFRGDLFLMMRTQCLKSTLLVNVTCYYYYCYCFQKDFDIAALALQKQREIGVWKNMVVNLNEIKLLLSRLTEFFQLWQLGGNPFLFCMRVYFLL